MREVCVMPLSRVRGVCHARVMHSVRVLAIHKPHVRVFGVMHDPCVRVCVMHGSMCHARVCGVMHDPCVRVFGVMHDPCVRVGVTHYHVGSCASHVLLMCFSCVSHVFLMCFSCVSHVCLMCASCVSQREAGV